MRCSSILDATPRAVRHPGAIGRGHGAVLYRPGPRQSAPLRRFATLVVPALDPGVGVVGRLPRVLRREKVQGLPRRSPGGDATWSGRWVGAAVGPIDAREIGGLAGRPG